MKYVRFCVAVFTGALATEVSAQDFAPSTLVGKTAVVVISNGNGVFSSVGGYRIAFSSSSPTYNVAPLSSGVAASNGTYSYSRNAGNVGRITLTDFAAGAAIEQALVFTSPTSASYSIANGTGSQTGTLVFENVTAIAAAGLANMSVRAQVPLGGQIIPGLVIDTPTRVLVRVAGPALAGFGVAGTLSNPKLTVMVGNVALVSNDDWSSSASNYDLVREAAQKVGAFAFTFGSRDSAIVLDLIAGNYTCIITGDSGASGEVLLEVYRIPP